MLHLITLFLIGLSLNCQAQPLGPEVKLRFMPSREQLKEIIAEEDAFQLSKLHHLNGPQFSDMLKKKGGSGKGGVFLAINEHDTSLLAVAAATSLGLIIFKHDAELMEYVQEHRTDVPQGVEDFGNFVGSRSGNAAIMAGSYFMGVVLKNGKLKKVGLISVGAGLATAIVTEAFKKTFGRTRPRDANGPYEFFGEGKSFFSGHSSSIFSIATVFSEVYGKQYPVVPYVAYGIATVTAYARMSSNAHWGSDVLTGAIAGVLITKVVYHFTNKMYEDQSIFISFYPKYERGSKSIQVNLNYIPRMQR